MTTEALALDTRLRAILAAASSPQERLAGRWVRGTAGPVADVRYARWQGLVAGGDPDRTAEVLLARGLDEARWRIAFGEPELLNGGPESPWVPTVRTLLDILGQDDPPAGPVPTLAEIAGPGLPDGVDPEQDWRFYPGFAAWLTAADRWLDERDPSVLDVQARRSLTNNLARRMLGTCGPVLMQASQSRTLFTGDSAQEWLSIWSEHPVIARLLAVTWEQWHTVVGEVMDRLARDLPGLAPGRKVRDIELGAGDMHAGGRGVAVILMDDGGALYLKPRNDGIHHVLQALLEAVDPGGRAFGLRLPDVIDRDGYVWVRRVDSGDCQDVTGYFYRAGALLRILQAVGATDLHHENFVATADQPVLVDLETALAAGVETDPDPSVAAALRDLPGPTSLVTSPVDGPPGTRSADLGALAGPDTRLTPYAVRTLRMAEDGPMLDAGRLPMTNGNALPIVDGRRVALRGHEESLVAGYLASQAALSAVDATEMLTGAAAETRVRMVVRPTRVYARLLANSLAPVALTDGAERGLVLERLWRAARTAPAELISAEQEAMGNLDIPMFTMPLDGAYLIDEQERAIPGFTPTAPGEVAVDTLAAVGARGGDGSELRAAVFAADPDPSPVSGSDLTVGPTLSADVLVQRAIDTSDGGATWLGLDYDPTRYRWRTGRLGPGLLGEAGIGLTLAALADDQNVFGDLARRALLEAVKRASRLDVRVIGSDGFTGPSGVLYAVARAGDLLGDAEVVDAAQSLLPIVLAAARRSRPTRGLDAVAGAALALLHLPFSGSRDDALGELADLLAMRPEGTFDEPDYWCLSMPSASAGRLMARHRLSAFGVCPAPVPADWLHQCDPLAPGDRAAMAESGLAVTAGSPATTWWDLLAETEIARSASVGGAVSAVDRYRDQLKALRRFPMSDDRRIGGSQAPADWLLSAVHGVAAWLLTSSGTEMRTPRVRVMQ